MSVWGPWVALGDATGGRGVKYIRLLGRSVAAQGGATECYAVTSVCASWHACALLLRLNQTVAWYRTLWLHLHFASLPVSTVPVLQYCSPD